MKNSRVTPGPWKAVTAEKTRVYGSYAVCELTGGEATRDKANAHLIAAAPELYEVLATAVRQGECILAGDEPEEGEDFDGWFLAAKAALAKARGEQP